MVVLVFVHILYQTLRIDSMGWTSRMLFLVLSILTTHNWWSRIVTCYILSITSSEIAFDSVHKPWFPCHARLHVAIRLKLFIFKEVWPLNSAYLCYLHGCPRIPLMERYLFSFRFLEKLLCRDLNNKLLIFLIGKHLQREDWLSKELSQYST